MSGAHQHKRCKGLIWAVLLCRSISVGEAGASYLQPNFIYLGRNAIVPPEQIAVQIAQAPFWTISAAYNRSPIPQYQCPMPASNAQAAAPWLMPSANAKAAAPLLAPAAYKKHFMPALPVPPFPKSTEPISPVYALLEDF